ncbi:MAG: rhomboid family intramembrane serine protease [Lentisphaeria bacterium]|nr:rhomboid family intramembrane serine protease [Lentisphaeria bacterium]
MLSDRDYMGWQGRRSGFPHQQASVIKPLIIINLIVFVLTGFGDTHSRMQALITLHPLYIRQLEVWRVGTYMFAHAGFFHVLMNMWGLFIFGSIVEARIGPRRLLNLYLVSGLVGGLCWLVANWFGDTSVLLAQAPGPEEMRTLKSLGAEFFRESGGGVIMQAAPSVILGQHIRFLFPFPGVVGASGAVFGVMMAAAMVAPHQKLMLIFPPIPITIRTLVIVYGVSEVFTEFRNAAGASSAIAHVAHLGGLVAAFFYVRQLTGRGPGDELRRAGDHLQSWWSKRRAKWRQEHFRVVGGEKSEVPPYNAETAREADRVLDKLAEHGEKSLTAEEKAILERTSEALRNRARKK